MNQIEELSYLDIHRYYRTIIRNMHLDNYMPDHIIALERGGADIGVKFSHYFKVPVTFVKWYTRDDTGKNISALVDCLNNNTSKNILIVDDICDSGTTFEGVHQYAAMHNVKYAAIIENIDNNFDCTWAGRYIHRNTETQWFQFPWENFWNDDTR